MSTTLHCNCDCPYFGVEHENVYVANCDCGEEELVCVYCLEEGRVTACLACSQAEGVPEPELPYAEEGVVFTKTHLLNEGLVDGRTGDDDPYFADAQAKDQAVFEQALAELRAAGEARPVFLVVHGDPTSARLLCRMLPALADALPLACLQDRSLTTYLVTQRVARAALGLSHVGPRADHIFCTPAWSPSYFTVRVCRGEVTVFESRTYDAAFDGPQAAA
jgi:hypothetical protein